MGAQKQLPSIHVSSVLRARDGSTWVGTYAGLVRFDGSSISRVDPFRGLSPRRAERLYQARDGAIWFCNQLDAPGAYRYDGSKWTRFGRKDGLLSDRVFCMAETSDGSLWFGMNEGLSRMKGKTVVNFTKHDGIAESVVHDIYVDADDVLWCAADQGVLRFDTKGFVGFTKRDGLSSAGGITVPVLAIEADPSGGFWIGTEWGGVFRLDGTNLRPMTQGGQGRYVRQIHRSHDGSWWYGTDAGILKLEGDRLVTVRPMENRWVLALGSDRQNNLWYGHGWQGDGLTRFNRETGETESFTMANGLPDDQVWGIASDPDGSVWVGTTGGLARYRDGKIEDYRQRLGLPTGTVHSLRRDAEGMVWVNSRLGLHRFNGRERISVTATNGLPDPHVWCSAHTRNDVIWMGTDRGGLLGYDGKAVTMIDQRDGLIGNQAFCMAPDVDGSLWLGFFEGGLSRFSPTRSRPSVRLVQMQLNDQIVTDFAKLPKIVTGNRVTWQYQEVDLKTHPDKRQFAYRVTGPSGEMVFAAVTKDRRFDWTPQKSGAYRFEVEAIDRDLNYSAPAWLQLQVTVPWHANGWILAPMVVAFGGLLIWAFVERALYQRKSREAALLRERIRIARDLHDHLGAGLTHLAMVGDVVRQQSARPDTVEMLGHRMSESARELTHMMEEIIWATDPAKDTLRSFALFVTSYAERFFADSPLRLRFEIPAEIPDLVLHSELRSSLLTVTKEALNNVAKHARASELRIKLELRDRELSLIFEDDGRGFSMDQVAMERRGLVNMRQRLRDLGGQLTLESGEGKGTRVQARLPLPRH